MRLIVLGPKNFGCIRYMILWRDAGHLWLESLRQLAILPVMEFRELEDPLGTWIIQTIAGARWTIPRTVCQIHGDSTSYCCRTG